MLSHNAVCAAGGPEPRLRPPAFFPAEVPADPRPSGEGESLDAALLRNRRWLTWVLSCYGVPEHDVDDLLQDLAVLALEKLAGEDVRRIGGWLRFAAHHLGQSYRRRRYREVKALGLLRLEARRWEGAGWSQQLRVEMRLDLARALRRLSPSLRRVVLLWVMGFSPARIAERTGYRQKSIRKLVQRGLVRLALHFANPLAERSARDPEPGWATRANQVLGAPEVHQVPGRPPVGHPLFSPAEGASPS